jgi:RimJ/RimL family protein N-acetyltransferase
MQWINLSSAQFFRSRKQLIQFFRYYGDKRITKEGMDWIRGVKQEEFDQPGTLVLCVVHNKKIIGVLIISNYGINESFIAVHKQYRNQDIAQQMVAYALNQFGKIYGRVALDNIPSMKICLDNGMVAFHLFTGPTQKPTLWMGGGNWKKEDVLDVE